MPANNVDDGLTLSAIVRSESCSTMSKELLVRVAKVLLTAVLLALSLAAPAAASTAGTGTRTEKAAQDVPETCYNSAPKIYCISWAPPSQGYIPCPSGSICLYSEKGFKGVMVRWPSGNYAPSFTDIQCPTASGLCPHGPGVNDFNDETSSWANNGTSYNYCFSRNVLNQPIGQEHTRAPIDDQDDEIAPGWNDEVSMLSLSGC